MPLRGCIYCICILDILCKVAKHIASNKWWKLCSSTTPLSFDAPYPRNPSKYPHISYIYRNTDLYFAADNVCPSSFKVFWWVPYNDFFARVRFGRSRSSKVIDFGTSWKHVCNFLLVHHSNLGPILCRFWDIAGFCAHDPPLFHPNFGGVSIAPDRPCWGQPEHKPQADQL